MRIIKKGNCEIEKTCKKCNCIFTYEPDDVETIYTEGVDVSRNYVTCPTCKEKVII